MHFAVELRFSSSRDIITFKGVALSNVKIRYDDKFQLRVCHVFDSLLPLECSTVLRGK